MSKCEANDDGQHSADCYDGGHLDGDVATPTTEDMVRDLMEDGLTREEATEIANEIEDVLMEEGLT